MSRDGTRQSTRNVRTAMITPNVPTSVINLWHGAGISHRDIVEPGLLLAAIRDGGGSGAGRRSLAIALQESQPGELVDLMIDKVLDGRALHGLLAAMQADGSIRRDDLVEWSEIFA